jgi:hypothetical protein
MSLCPGTLAFCDNFENGNLDRWTIASNGAPDPVVETTRAYRGSRSAHFAVSGQGPAGYPDAALTTAALASPLYIRLFVYVPVAVQTSDLFWLNDNNGSFCAVRLDGNTLLLNSNDARFPAVASTVKPRHDGWSCVEMFYDDGNHEIRVWLDDTEISALHATGWTGSGLDQLAVRASTESPGPDVDLWYDEIAMDTQRIGCSR